MFQCLELDVHRQTRVADFRKADAPEEIYTLLKITSETEHQQRRERHVQDRSRISGVRKVRLEMQLLRSPSKIVDVVQAEHHPFCFCFCWHFSQALGHAEII